MKDEKFRKLLGELIEDISTTSLSMQNVPSNLLTANPLTSIPKKVKILLTFLPTLPAPYIHILLYFFNSFNVIHYFVIIL